MTAVAVFWDRDDTLLRDPGYIREPEQVEILPGAAAALKILSEAGFENIIVTNQSGIARGLFDEATLERIHDRMVGQFAEQGAKIDAIYYCPYLAGEEATVERFRQDSHLRKPKPGMILQASMERKIDLAGSWVIGDSLHDAQAGRAAGCRTILVRKPNGGELPRKGGDVDFVADSAEHAARVVLKYTRSSEKSLAAGTAAEKPADGRLPEDAQPSTAVLQEILAFLRTVDRRSRADHFSLGQMAGTLVQMLVIGVAVWSIFGWLRGDASVDLLVRIQFAVLLQLVALTAFLAGTRR